MAFKHYPHELDKRIYIIPGVSLKDDDVSEFLTVMTKEKCIADGQQLLQEDPNASVLVAGSKDAEEKVFEGSNRTGGGMHILCAGLSTKNEHGTTGLISTDIKTELCYVPYNETLANYLLMDEELNDPSEKTERLINTIYRSSCTFNKHLNKLVSVKVVDHGDQCYFHKLSSERRLIKYEETVHIIGIFAIIMASLGIIGNGMGLSVHLSTRCEKRQSVYFVTKGLSEILLLGSIILKVSFNFTENTTDIIIPDYLHPILYQLSLFGRNWITVVLGIEKCLAVWAPFFARAHFGRGLEIKISLITVGISTVYTSCDFLTMHFISYLARVIDTDNLFVGSEIKMPIYSVIIYSLLPWTIVLISSIVAVVGVILSRKKRADLTNASAQEGNDQADSNNSDLVLPVLFNLFSFIISNIPVVMYIALVTVENTIEKVLLSDKYAIIIGAISLFFNIIGFSMDFYLSLAVREGFGDQFKANMHSIKNIFLRQDN